MGKHSAPTDPSQTPPWRAVPDDDELLALLIAAACPAPCPGRRDLAGNDWHAGCESRAAFALRLLRPKAAQASAGYAAARGPWGLSRCICPVGATVCRCDAATKTTTPPVSVVASRSKAPTSGGVVNA